MTQHHHLGDAGPMTGSITSSSKPLVQQITSSAPVPVIGLYRQSKLDTLCRSPATLGPHTFRLPFGLGGRRTVEVECGLADAGTYDDDVGWLCGGVALTVHSAFRYVYEVAGTRLHRVRAVRTKFHAECTGEDVDHR